MGFEDSASIAAHLISEMPETPEELQLVAVLIAISFNHVTHLRSISLLLHADIWVLHHVRDENRKKMAD